VETYGTDSSKCGTQRLPCRTIEYGIYRAQQVQPDPLVSSALEDMVTVQVGPGTYDQPLLVTSAEWIHLVGAGEGLTIVPTVTVMGSGPRSGLAVRSTGPLYVEGFTFTGTGYGVYVQQATVYIRQCAFTGSGRGLAVLDGTAVAHHVTFTGNATAVTAAINGVVQLSDFEITGSGTGVGVNVQTDSYAYLLSMAAPSGWYTPVRPARVENVGRGVVVQLGAYVAISDVAMSGNNGGIFADGAAVDCWGCTINDNADWGVILRNSARAALDSVAVNNNGTGGLFVFERSFLRTFGGEVTGNGEVGVSLAAFSQAVIDPATDLSGNGVEAIRVDAYSAYLNLP